MRLAPAGQFYLFFFGYPEVVDAEMFVGYAVFAQLVEYVCYVVEEQ